LLEYGAPETMVDGRPGHHPTGALRAG